MLIILLLVIVAAHWVFYYGVNILKLLRSEERDYISMHLYIKQKSHLSIYITGLEFSSSSGEWVHRVNAGDFNYSNKNMDEPIFTTYLLLPKNISSFKLSWYSFTEGKYYTDEFPFSLDRYKLIADTSRAHDITDYNINQQFIDRYSFFMPKKIKSLTLSMKEQGDIDLLQTDNIKYVFYIKVLTEDRSEQDLIENEASYNAMLLNSINEESDRGESL